MAFVRQTELFFVVAARWISGRRLVRFAWQLFDSGADIFPIQFPLKLLALVSGLELIQRLRLGLNTLSCHQHYEFL